MRIVAPERDAGPLTRSIRIQHLKDAVALGDTAHEPAAKDMKGRWRKPISGMKWYRQVQKDFAELPEATPSAS